MEIARRAVGFRRHPRLCHIQGLDDPSNADQHAELAQIILEEAQQVRVDLDRILKRSRARLGATRKGWLLNRRVKRARKTGANIDIDIVRARETAT